MYDNSTQAGPMPGQPLPTDITDSPVIAVTYSSTEFAEFHPSVAWQLALRAVVAAGGVPLSIDCATPQPRIAELVQLADGLLVLGGGDVDPTLSGADPSDPLLEGVNPVRDRNEINAMAAARQHDRPMLAICRGFQLLNVANGGRLVADLRRDQPGAIDHRPGMPALTGIQHPVTVDPDSRVAQWMSQSGLVDVNSQHHQGVLAVGTGLKPTAYAADGLVEAVEDSDGLVVGIQWHPEFIWRADRNALALLSGFVRQCSAARTSPDPARRVGHLAYPRA